MSFISILKSPLKNKHIFSSSSHSSKNNDSSILSLSTTASIDSRRLVVYPIDTEDDTNYNVVINNDELGDVLMDKVCDFYGLSEYKEYFGLRYTLMDEKGNHEILWLDLLKHIGKQLKDSNNVLTFRVKHFPANPHKVDCEHVRYLFFLQLKNYLQKGELQLSLNDECILAGCIVQAIYEDYDENIHKGNYIEDQKFISKKTPKSDEMIIEEHKKLKGLKRVDAEALFLEKVSQFNTYGAEIIVVKNKQNVLINFGVSHKGIITYLYGQPANVARIELYTWSQIGRVYYENRSLYINAHTTIDTNPEIIKKHTMVFKCYSERMCKHLWKLILDQRAFFTYNRGTDVPKLKSSKGFFKRSSKFRYTGRCEHEILVSQHDTSLNSSSTYSTFRRKFEFKQPLNLTNTSITTPPRISTTLPNTMDKIDKSLSDSGVSENFSETLPLLSVADDTINEEEATSKIDENTTTPKQQQQQEPNATSTPQQTQKQITNKQQKIESDSSIYETTNEQLSSNNSSSLNEYETLNSEHGDDSNSSNEKSLLLNNNSNNSRHNEYMLKP